MRLIFAYLWCIMHKTGRLLPQKVNTPKNEDTEISAGPGSTDGKDTEKGNQAMKILFLGNSFTYYNDLPKMLSEISGGKLSCESVTRGDAYLSEYSETDSEVRGKLDTLLANGESFDFVVLQEQSLLPATNAEKTLESARAIVRLIPDTSFALYQTWSYKRGSKKLASTGFSFEEMTDSLAAGYRQVGEAIGASVIPVGAAFAEADRRGLNLYNDDDCYHPNVMGTYLAACVFYRAFTGNSADDLATVEGISDGMANELKEIANLIDVLSTGQ